MRRHPKPNGATRKLAGLSQADMAGMLGISREVLANHEAGHQRDLPPAASMFLTFLQIELNKPEIQPPSTTPALSETAAKKLRDKLDFMARENRYKAVLVQQQIDKCLRLYKQAQKRKSLLPIVEKVHGIIEEIGKGQPDKWLNEYHHRWLDRAKGHSDFNQTGEEHWVQQQLLQLKHKMLLLEAEEAEKMMGNWLIS